MGTPRPILFLFPPSMGELRANVRAELLTRMLSRRLGRLVVLDVAASYAEQERRVLGGEVDVAWAPPDLCLKAESRARAILKAVRSGRTSYHAALVCRAGERLRVEDLRGRKAAWVAPTSTGGYLLAAAHLRKLGHDPSTLLAAQQYHGSYLGALQAVLRGEADVASIYAHTPDERGVRDALAQHVGVDEERFAVVAITDASPTDGIVIGATLTPDDAGALSSLFVEMEDRAPGAAVLLQMFDAEAFVSERREAAEPGPAPAPAVSVRAAIGPASGPLFVEVDAGGTCLRAWSAGARGTKGLAIEGRGVVDVFGEEPGREIAEAIARVARSGEPQRFEIRVHGGAEPRWLWAEVAPGPNRMPALVALRDITGRKAMEDELLLVASYPLLDPSPVVEVDLDGVVRYANPASRRQFPDLLERGSAHPLLRAALDSCSWGAEPRTMQFELEVGTGYHHVVAVYWPELGALRVFATDITERKRMEARLAEAERLRTLGLLAAGVAHELNNPLAYIIANLDFVRGVLDRNAAAPGSAEAAVDLRKVSEALAEAAHGAERARVVVGELRQLSRHEKGREAPVDLRHVLETSLRMLASEIVHAKLVKVLGEVPAVEGSEARLGQVLINLLTNAAHAVRGLDRGEAVIRVESRTDAQGRAVVQVSDTGAGMSPDVLGRIFDPFFTTRAEGTGTGLGLFISRNIAAEMGGTLEVESEVGKGSTFRLVLPPQARPGEWAAAVPASGAAPARVLVIDDDAAFGASVQRMLEGHDVVAVSEAWRAIEVLVADGSFDVILCDLVMPGTTGREVYEVVRQIRPAVAARFVFVTGALSGNQLQEILGAIPNPCLEKPLNAARLKALVAAGSAGGAARAGRA